MDYTTYVKLVYRAWRYRMKLEPAEVRFALRTLQPGDTAIDIGAHKGAFTYWLRKRVGPGGQVFAFEPQPVLAQRLTATFKGSQSNVTVTNSALSSQPGMLTLRVPVGGPSPGATLEPKAFGVACDEYEVRVDTLDRFFADLPPHPVRLIKCDVEGHELDVFRGGEQLLRRDRPALLFECERRHHVDGNIEKVFAFLNELGYEGSFFLGRRRLPLEQFCVEKHQEKDGDTIANNFAFTPRSKMDQHQQAA